MYCGQSPINDVPCMGIAAEVLILLILIETLASEPTAHATCQILVPRVGGLCEQSARCLELLAGEEHDEKQVEALLLMMEKKAAC
jgi:hypothetical protein